MIWWIVLAVILGFWLIFRFKRILKHKNVIGKKVIVKYFDQNYHFEKIFPLIGIITKKIN